MVSFQYEKLIYQETIICQAFFCPKTLDAGPHPSHDFSVDCEDSSSRTEESLRGLVRRSIVKTRACWRLVLAAGLRLRKNSMLLHLTTPLV